MNHSPRAEAAALKASPYRGGRASSEPARYLSMSLARGETICPVSVDGSILSPRRSSFRTPFASSPILLAGTFTASPPKHISSMVQPMSDRGSISAAEQLHQARHGFSISPRTRHVLTPRSYVRTTRLASYTAHRYHHTQGISQMMHSSADGYVPHAVNGGDQASLPLVLDRMAKKPQQWPRMIDDVASMPKAMQPHPPASHVGWERRAALESLEARQSQLQQQHEEEHDEHRPMQPHPPRPQRKKQPRKQNSRVTFDSAAMSLPEEASLVSVASSAKDSPVLSRPQSRGSVQGLPSPSGGSFTRQGHNSMSRTAPAPPPLMNTKSLSQTKMRETSHNTLAVFQDLLSSVEQNNARNYLDTLDRSQAGKIQVRTPRRHCIMGVDFRVLGIPKP